MGFRMQAPSLSSIVQAAAGWSSMAAEGSEMLLRFALLAFLAAGAFGQELTGVVGSLSADELQVGNENGSVTIHAGDKTTVCTGKEFHDLLALRVGDEVRIRFHEDASHRRIADAISTRVTMSGMVTESSTDALRVRSSPNRMRLVHLDASTEFGIGPRPPRTGQEIHIVGWNVDDGQIDAERVAIYNTDLPMTQDFRK
jgi:hypothetical protein